MKGLRRDASQGPNLAVQVRHQVLVVPALALRVLQARLHLAAIRALLRQLRRQLYARVSTAADVPLRFLIKTTRARRRRYGWLCKK